MGKFEAHRKIQEINRLRLVSLSQDGQFRDSQKPIHFDVEMPAAGSGPKSRHCGCNVEPVKKFSNADARLSRHCT
jgi:hypothetical protein